jgi:hypothetical protein
VSDFKHLRIAGRGFESHSRHHLYLIGFKEVAETRDCSSELRKSTTVVKL